ncbi:DUF802 domain-containing protein [Cupriavidus sp. AU9028]|uniref:DUF802 domain-containing protein n=1 Tax=Cupriavidus sp. AU9028 TaxID=2871157 RepID=UPI001C96E8D6|nr:DUF802 domain-containing protein [Cupriavidus sp. AU9028]MBY4895929.1 DUF802 domain-containing protein [Cupriavidus sp. AU9028]
MTRPYHFIAVFAAGLAVLLWIALGYAGTNLLALAVTLVIGGFYAAGAAELVRYRRATASLHQAVANLGETPACLSSWLGQLPAALQNPVRLRVEGERVPLPGPSLTPYLVGLLVLLGMLGTFLGMIATLRGTGLALETAADLAAIRSSLAAPVKGLGFAFGTSVAGVATSAMLGLLAALARRERVHAAQALDAAIATTLRPYSRAHQRDEAFRLLQRQADVMPALVERMQDMMHAMEQQNRLLGERLAEGQAAARESTEQAWGRLAASVGQALQESVANGAEAARAAIEPSVQATMASLAGQSAALRESVDRAVQQQLDGMTQRLDSTAAELTRRWNDALDGQQRTNDATAARTQAMLEAFSESFERRATALVETVGARLDASSERTALAWEAAAARQLSAGEQLAAASQQAVTAASAAFAQHAAALLESVDRSHGALQDRLQAADEARLAAWREALADSAAQLRAGWEHTSEAVTARQQAICETLSHTSLDIASRAQEHATRTIAEIDRLLQAAAQAPKAAAALHQELAERDAQRLAAWSAQLESIARSVGAQWEQAGQQAAQRQQRICETLAQTASELGARTEAQARDTIAQVAQLVQSAAEAPKAAAEVIAELRHKLTEGMARDNAMLEERGRLLETLATLLDAVNHASNEQRVALDRLVGSTADLLDRVGSRFADTVAAESGKLAGVAAQVSGSAAEVANLGEAFGTAVQQFASANERLLERLQAIEAAMDKSLSRSDEQLAYYVAQAREVVDLSILSQKQILEELQQAGGGRAAGMAA